MLPDFDGLEVLRRMRGEDPNVPVLFLTAKDAVEDRVAGLTAGGDDYVTKPFSLEEVVARLRGLMRRAGSAQSADSEPILRVGDLTLNEDSHEVERSGDQFELTATDSLGEMIIFEQGTFTLQVNKRKFKNSLD